jgi:penicillin-binding protein 1A
MGSNLPLFAYGETDDGSGGGGGTATITTSSGETRVVPGKADLGTLSSGGLY